ncbi:hypothetical protein SAMN05444172_1266 [Burkholderia sp. GAS332]|nr:hypothetical protein SAMN05444172_1266 [Burkholderia sp. GAS332]
MTRSVTTHFDLRFMQRPPRTEAPLATIVAILSYVRGEEWWNRNINPTRRPGRSIKKDIAIGVRVGHALANRRKMKGRVRR